MTNYNLHISTATAQDLPEILRIYEGARTYMRLHGNPTQWGYGNPPVATVIHDIETRKLYKVADSKGRLCAVFFFEITDDEPTYRIINDGKWLAQGHYGVIHRMASAGIVRGVSDFVLRWCFDQHAHLRIDTHKDNISMQSAIERAGFEYCGIITVTDGSERLAYEKI